MANTDRPNGFVPATGYGYNPPHKWVVAGSEAIAIGDMVYINSAGRIALATASTAAVCGVAASPVAATASAGDDIWVWDNPTQAFEGQTSGSGALADPYTCATSGSCFDIEGTTGIHEINEDASTYDIIKIIGIGRDPVTGEASAVGANQRKIFIVNPIKHQLGIYS